MESNYRIFDILDRYKTIYQNKSDVFGFKDDKIATIIANSPDWNFIDMGIQQIGAVHVPIYPTISIDNFKHIFENAEVKIVFIEDEEFYQFIKPALNDKIETFITIKNVNGLLSWNDFLQKGKGISHSVVEEIKKDIDTDDVMSIIYTSGTTGSPKGVMLTHRNFSSNFKGCLPILRRNPVERALSFLPLCHVYERMLGYVYQHEGVSVYYVKDISLISESLQEIKPEMFCSVPRVLEKSYDKIINKARNLPKLQKIIFYWALGVAEMFDHHAKRNFIYDIKLKIADILVYSKIRNALGGRVKLVVSGGAMLQSKISRTFWATGVNVMEGYGLTETSPVIAVSSYDKGIKIGTVGPILEGVQVKFASDGEILCKGPNVMKGYYNNPQQTAEIIDSDGWLHTGDIGHLEDGKYLRITDRKKEIFKTSGGKYVAPQVVESKIKESPFIENIFVIGENQKFTGAIIVPNIEHIEAWCKVKSIPYSSSKDILENRVIFQRIKREVDKYGMELDKTERVKVFRIVLDEWTVETNELSPTLKLKRNVLNKKYDSLIRSIYE